jgi:hypothetical protein
MTCLRTFKTRVRLAPALLFVLLSLAACGGGGDGGVMVPPPPGLTGLTGLALRRDGGTLSDVAEAVASYPDGSIVVTGQLEGSATFGAGEPGETLVPTSGTVDGFIARYTPAMTLAWVRRIGGSGKAVGRSVAVAPNGDCVITGNFDGDAQFEDGQGGHTALTTTSASDQDAFVVRYGPDGTLLWARQAQGPLAQSGNGVAVAADGTAYVAGGMDGMTTFGKQEPNETTVPTFGGADMFLARFATDGSLMWATLAGGTLADWGRSVAAHPAGGCVVSGDFHAGAAFGLFEANSTVLNAVGYTDVFLARYGADGKLVWAKSAGGATSDVGYSVGVLSDGSIAVTGAFQGSVIFGQGEPGQQILQGAGAYNFYLARYGAGGSLMWAKQAYVDDQLQGFELAVAPDDAIYVSGPLRGQATFGQGEPTETTHTTLPGLSDAYLARYAADGSFEWLRPSGSDSIDIARGVAVLPSGAAVFVGEFRETAVFGLGHPGAQPLVSAGGGDIFVARHAPDGDLE